jgi:predicted PurR-regulated permease PerM
VDTAQNWNFSPKLIFTLLALIVSIWLVVRLTDVAILLAVAVLLAAIMQPPITWLARRSVPRGAAVLLIYLVLFGLLALCIYLLTPIFASQLAQLASDSWYSRLQQWTNQWQARSEQTLGLALLGELPTQLGALVQTWVAELGRQPWQSADGWRAGTGDCLFFGGGSQLAALPVIQSATGTLPSTCISLVGSDG